MRTETPAAAVNWELSNLLTALADYYGQLLLLLADRFPQPGGQDSLPTNLLSLRSEALKAHYPDVLGTCLLLQVAIDRVDATLAADSRAELTSGRTTLSRTAGANITHFQELARGYVGLCRMHQHLFGRPADWSPAGSQFDAAMGSLHAGIWAMLETGFDEIAFELSSGPGLTPTATSQGKEQPATDQPVDWVTVLYRDI